MVKDELQAESTSWNSELWVQIHELQGQIHEFDENSSKQKR